MTEVQPVALRVDLQDPTGTWIPAGILQRQNERTTFSSFPQYWESPRRPVLGQIFEQRGPDWRPSSSTALPAWFSNLLPEGRLRQAIADDTGVNEGREFYLLARIGGDDLPGALRVVEVEPGEEPLEANFEEPDQQTNHGSDQALKFSLAGVQLKFAVVENDRGLTIPASGDSSRWIAKLPDLRPGFEHVPEAEFAALELARAAGIEVPRTRLLDVASISGLPSWATAGGGKAVVIERFDRKDGRRIHAEELAQVMNLRPNRKYERANFETIARFTSGLTTPESVGAVIDRVVFNVLIGNGDAHVKNWAFIYEDGITPVLAPAYDVIPTVLFLPHDDLGLNLNGSKVFEDVDVEDFARLAEKAEWDRALGRQRAKVAIERTISAWPLLRDLLSAERYKALTDRRDSLTKLLP